MRDIQADFWKAHLTGSFGFIETCGEVEQRQWTVQDTYRELRVGESNAISIASHYTARSRRNIATQGETGHLVASTLDCDLGHDAVWWCRWSSR
jgi:hypothetical protein